MWIGGRTLPHPAYFAAFMQQTAPLLRESDVVESNKILKELKDLRLTIRFNSAGKNTFTYKC